jgi:hypothetical protein
MLITLYFAGNAIFVHGVAWGYYPSDYRVFIDNDPPLLYYANSSLANRPSGLYIDTDGLMFFQVDFSSGTHVLKIDNNGGVGWIGLDYIEVVTVTGGTPCVVNVHLPSSLTKPDLCFHPG